MCVCMCVPGGVLHELYGQVGALCCMCKCGLVWAEHVLCVQAWYKSVLSRCHVCRHGSGMC